MIERHYSFIIPVYNRPEEMEELLESLSEMEGDFEVIIIEDGSENSSEEVVSKFNAKLNISYYFKENTGPGDSRNYGMRKAKGNYFIILDSDVIVPSAYLKTVNDHLSSQYLDCYGGGDKSQDSFTDIQKAIDYAMTSFLTTGGIRGSAHSRLSKTYEPRSFNMGISKAAFIESGGFGSIHPGEDPDLSIRLKKQKFKVGYIEAAFVYHKRRVDFLKFSSQVNKFGLVRPILLKRYPETNKITYWFPFFYSLFFVVGMFLLFFGLHFVIYFYVLYNFLILIDSTMNYKTIKIGLLSVISTNIQFFSYGSGFIKSYYFIHILKKKPQLIFPQLFFSQ